MPDQDLAEAFKRVQKRKTAAGFPAAVDEADEGRDLRDGRGALAGTDLQVGDVERVASMVVAQSPAIIARSGVDVAIASGWLDGLLVGLALAELRLERERRAREDRRYPGGQP